MCIAVAYTLDHVQGGFGDPKWPKPPDAEGFEFAKGIGQGPRGQVGRGRWRVSHGKSWIVL